MCQRGILAAALCGDHIREQSLDAGGPPAEQKLWLGPGPQGWDAEGDLGKRQAWAKVSRASLTEARAWRAGASLSRNSSGHRGRWSSDQ